MMRRKTNRRSVALCVASGLIAAGLALPVATSAQDPVDTTITNGPKAKTKSTTATFEFSASGPVTGFKCKLGENGVFKDCSSPKTYKHLKPGNQHFEAAAEYPSGAPPGFGFPETVIDETPATYDWTVKKKHRK